MYPVERYRASRRTTRAMRAYGTQYWPEGSRTMIKMMMMRTTYAPMFQGEIFPRSWYRPRPSM
jgi:hypothetical protein